VIIYDLVESVSLDMVKGGNKPGFTINPILGCWYVKMKWGRGLKINV
jgi:hypothetical protein